MPLFQIVHRTAYRYDEAASLCYNECRMLPRAVSDPQFEQQVLGSQVSLSPGWDDSRERIDYFGNRTLYYTIRRPHAEMAVTVTSRVEILPGLRLSPGERADPGLSMAAGEAGEPQLNRAWEEAVTQLQSDLGAPALEARQYALSSPLAPTSPGAARFVRPSFPAGAPLLEAVAHLMARIVQEFEFTPGATTVSTPVDEVLRRRTGVCQDFAHLTLACLRSLGLAARYVSGYVETLPPPGQEKLQGADASHAWCALFVPDWGWLHLDPTNNLFPHDQHVVLGWGRDFADVTPLKGLFFGEGKHELDVAVDMIRVDPPGEDAPC